MSKLLEIQQQLRAIDPAAFQHLCDALLHARGYDQITSLGSVLGANKVTSGTPDTRVALPDGRFVFAEYTTQQTATFAKLHDDLRKCFNETITGIPVSRIREIVICHNAKLSTDEEASLIDECRRRGVGCLILGPSPIALDLYRHYPTLARDFLGVAVDTGQILPPGDFVRAYNKSAVAPPIDTAFQFRTGEMDKALAALRELPLLIITGRAGVGKTRFALECVSRFTADHSEIITYAIHNRGANLFDDVRAYFGPPGHYLILVDDANRLAGLEHVLQVLHACDKHQSAKLIITVRDYAQKKLVEAVRPYGRHALVALEPFSNEQIRELAREGHGVQHHVLLDRIVAIAKGNPRLAVMAVRAAGQGQSFERVRDASDLYDLYFASVRSDLGAFENDLVLAVAGIIAFFRVVDRANVDMMSIIEREFGISPASFWTAAMQLHDLEIVDEYDHEVVRISDQVLSTYLFYLAVFKTKRLPLERLLGGLFPQFQHRLTDALKPVVETFSGSAVIDEVRTQVARAWRRLAEREDDPALLHLVDTFAGLRPTEALHFAKVRIERMTPEPQTNDELAESGSRDVSVPTPSLLSILRSFRSSDPTDARMAVELLCDYVAKKPSDRERVLHILQEDYGIDSYSYLREYACERAVIDVLTMRSREGEDPLFAEMFLAIADAYLQTEFERTRSDGRKAIIIQRFTAPLTPQLDEVRKQIWEASFRFFRHARYQSAILRMLVKHARPARGYGGDEVIGKDAPTVLAFVTTTLEPTNYGHCAAVLDYLDFLDQHHVTYDAALRQRFRSETTVLAETLTASKLKRSGLGWREQHDKWLADVRALVAGYDVAAYGQFLVQCAEIRHAGREARFGYPLETAIVVALRAAVIETPADFVALMRVYLRKGNQLELGPGGLVPDLIASMGADAAFEFLLSESYFGKRRWIAAFLQVLPKTEVRPRHLEALYAFYEEASAEELPFNLEYLERYADLDRSVLHRIVAILIRRAEADPRVARALGPLFNDGDDGVPASAFQALVKEDPVLLRRTYFAVLEDNAHADWDGKFFGALHDKDPEFLAAYTDWVVSRADDYRWSGRDRDYSFLWKRSDYAAVMGFLVERLYDGLREHRNYWGYYPERLFLNRGNEESADREVQSRQDEILGQLLRERGHEEGLVRALFTIIANFSTERRLTHVRTLVATNLSLELFSTLNFEPSHMTWSGSIVPVLERRAAFWRSARGIFGRLELLGHKRIIEERLESACEAVERAKRAEFMED